MKKKNGKNCGPCQKEKNSNSVETPSEVRRDVDARERERERESRTTWREQCEPTGECSLQLYTLEHETSNRGMVLSRATALWWPACTPWYLAALATCFQSSTLHIPSAHSPTVLSARPPSYTVNHWSRLFSIYVPFCSVPIVPPLFFFFFLNANHLGDMPSSNLMRVDDCCFWVSFLLRFATSKFVLNAATTKLIGFHENIYVIQV